MSARLLTFALGASLSLGAHALTVTPLADEGALRAALGGAGEPLVRFVGEGRIGDRDGVATFEYDIGRSTGAPSQTGQFNWQDGSPVSLLFRYDDATGRAELKINGAPTLQYVVPMADRGVAAIYLRAFSSDAPGDFVAFSNLRLAVDGAPGSPFAVPFAGTNGARFAAVGLSGEPFANGFALTGDVVLGWNDSIPSQSNLAFQLKVAAIPEPESVALLALGLAAVVGFGLRRRA